MTFVAPRSVAGRLFQYLLIHTNLPISTIDDNHERLMGKQFECFYGYSKIYLQANERDISLVHKWQKSDISIRDD